MRANELKHFRNCQELVRDQQLQCAAIKVEIYQLKAQKLKQLIVL